MFMEHSYEIHLTRYFDELKRKGYKEDEVVAIDFENGGMLFYMTSGDIIRINHPVELSLIKKEAQA